MPPISRSAPPDKTQAAVLAGAESVPGGYIVTEQHRIQRAREFDEDRIEAYSGTVSLPFELDEHRHTAIKIADNRGIERLKVMDLSE